MWAKAATLSVIPAILIACVPREDGPRVEPFTVHSYCEQIDRDMNKKEFLTTNSRTTAITKARLIQEYQHYNCESVLHGQRDSAIQD